MNTFDGAWVTRLPESGVQQPVARLPDVAPQKVDESLQSLQYREVGRNIPQHILDAMGALYDAHASQDGLAAPGTQTSLLGKLTTIIGLDINLMSPKTQKRRDLEKQLQQLGARRSAASLLLDSIEREALELELQLYESENALRIAGHDDMDLIIGWCCNKDNSGDVVEMIQDKSSTQNNQTQAPPLELRPALRAQLSQVSQQLYEREMELWRLQQTSMDADPDQLRSRLYALEQENSNVSHVQRQLAVAQGRAAARRAGIVRHYAAMLQRDEQANLMVVFSSWRLAVWEDKARPAQSASNADCLGRKQDSMMKYLASHFMLQADRELLQTFLTEWRVSHAQLVPKQLVPKCAVESRPPQTAQDVLRYHPDLVETMLLPARMPPKPLSPTQRTRSIGDDNASPPRSPNYRGRRDSAQEIHVRLYKNEGEALGAHLDVEGGVATIQAVLDKGLLKDWNDQNPSSLVCSGDTIVSVNDVSAPTDAIAAELKKSGDLNIVLRRERWEPGKASRENRIDKPTPNEKPDQSHSEVVVETQVQLHKLDGNSLGCSLVVEGTHATIKGEVYGLLHDWNAQNPEQLIGDGDQIVAANGIRDSGEEIVAELRKTGDLELSIVRSGRI